MKHKIIIIFLAMVIGLLLVETVSLNNSIEAKEENIEIIENEVDDLYEELKNTNQQVREYKNKIDELEQENAELISYKYYENIPLGNSTQRLIQDLCKESEIEYELVLGLLQLESQFNPDLLSNTNDAGIAQINLRYIEWYAELAELENYNPYDIEHSIKMCIAGLDFYKNDLIKQGLEGEELTIMLLGVYNRGNGGMNKYLRENGTIHTVYSNKVLEHRDNFLNI